MNPPTESEILFQKFCDGLELPCQKIPEGQKKTPTGQEETPDYDITLGGHAVVAEVKQLDQNEEDKEGWAKLRTGTVAEFIATEVRVRRKIKRAETQLSIRCQGKLPGMLVLYDNGSLGGTEMTDIKNAMFGDEQVKLLRRNSDRAIVASTLHPAENGACTKTERTTVSAVGLFFWLGGGYKLSVFHNHFAAVPINPDWFRHDRFSHFGIRPDMYEWRSL